MPDPTLSLNTTLSLKDRVHALIAEIEKSGVGRELALAKTKLEEAVHWLESHHAKSAPPVAAPK